MSSVARLLHPVIKIILYLIYQPLACTYDWVASIVSLDKWKSWILTILPRLQGNNILELGHGPGHLQRAMAQKGFTTVGIDASRQMIHIARRRLARDGFPIRLSRAKAESLPFASRSFDSVTATFPAEYILSENTLCEIHRVLKVDGVLLILLSGWITGTSIPEKLIACITHITGAMPKPGTDFNPLLERYAKAGYSPEIVWVDQPGSTLLYLQAKKVQPLKKEDNSMN